MTVDPTIRLPAVAGRFYPGDRTTLTRDVGGLLARGAADTPPRSVAAVMAPHAGYIYSGDIAGQVFARIEVPRTVVVLCPNHTGRGQRVAVVTEGAFRIPGADIPIATGLASALVAEIDSAENDRAAHAREHAIEVELPFLLARQPALRIVPIVLAGLDETEAIALGKALHRVIASAGDDVLMVASSDMSHFLADDDTRRIDEIALAPLLALDPSGLYRTVTDNDISMCGYIPATAMLAYAMEQSCAAPELVGYATSGDVSGDHSRVVGYAGVLVPR